MNIYGVGAAALRAAAMKVRASLKMIVSQR